MRECAKIVYVFLRLWYNIVMNAVIWLTIDLTAFVLYVLAGVMSIARRHDLPTLDKTRAFPDSDKTDFAPVHAFSLGAGITALAMAAVFFVVVPLALWLADVADSIITGAVCGCAAVGAVILFFADKIFLGTAKEENR